MSYFSTALQRCAERRQLNQSDLAKRSGVSNSHISRLYNGESRDLSDANFSGLLNAFATDPSAQAEIIAARCQDVLAVARAALSEAGAKPEHLAAVAATQGPGLPNALMIGCKVCCGLPSGANRPMASPLLLSWKLTCRSDSLVLL